MSVVAEELGRGSAGLGYSSVEVAVGSEEVVGVAWRSAGAEVAGNPVDLRRRRTEQVEVGSLEACPWALAAFQEVARMAAFAVVVAVESVRTPSVGSGSREC